MGLICFRTSSSFGKVFENLSYLFDSSIGLTIFIHFLFLYDFQWFIKSKSQNIHYRNELTIDAAKPASDCDFFFQ